MRASWTTTRTRYNKRRSLVSSKGLTNNTVLFSFFQDDTAYSSLENSALTNPEAGNDESVDDEEKSIEDEMKEDDEGEDDEVENADDSGHKSS